MARVHAKLQALHVLNWRSAWALTEGVPDMADASALKVMGSEFFVEWHTDYYQYAETMGTGGNTTVLGKRKRSL